MDPGHLRDLLPLTRDFVYLNTGWSGPSPKPVVDRVREVLEQESEAGPASQAGLDLARMASEDAQRAIGRLIGAAAEDVHLTHSTSEGVNIVVHGLDWQPGDELLICDLEHPALKKPAEVVAERRGVSVVTANVPPRASQADAFGRISDAMSARTRLVALSHVQFTCGLRMPLEEIALEARRRGILFLVDGAQGPGHLPVNVQNLGCDFYALSGQKWLMGPSGTGALYIRPDHQQKLEPILTTSLVESRAAQARSLSSQLSLGSHSPGLLAGMTEAVRIAEELGPARVLEYVLSLSDLLRDRVLGIPGCSLLSPSNAESSCGLVTIALDGWRPEELASVLDQRRHIVARVVRSPDGVRFSTAPFNTEDEIERVAGALFALAGERP